MREYLESGIKLLDLNLPIETIDKLIKYAEELLAYNTHTNLTAIRDNEDLIEKHFIDSLIVHKKLPIREGNAIDIGTGAGFPGMVLAICNPNINFTLMDSVGKKTKFLEKIKILLLLKNVEVINGRAEDFIKERRETYDLGLCRGVNRLNVILEYVVPFIKENGIFFPQKLEYIDEIEEAKNALKILNCSLEEVVESKLPFSGAERIILKIRKNAKTDNKYPRRAGVALKKPL